MKRFLIPFLLMVIFFLPSGHSRAQENRAVTIQPVRLPNQRGKQVQIYRESHALVIGMSKYASGWPPLPGVYADVQAVAEALEKQGFKVVKALDLTHDQLDQAFRDFIASHGRDPQNRLLFYFAGHGHTIAKAWGDSLGYIVPVDAPDPRLNESEFLRKAINMRRVDEYAREIDSKHALFLFDCCFSGVVFETTRAIPEDISYKTALPVRQFITSGSADEKVPDRSIFRRQFVSALEGEADSNKDSYITGTELGMFLQDKVINYSEGAQHPQYGKIRNPNLDRGDFVFQVQQPEVSLSLAAPQPAPPGESAFSIEDLERKAAEQEKTRAQWAQWLENMKKGLAEVEALEKRDLPAADKALAWQRFLEAYGEDNTYTAEDDRLRKRADERLRYWRNYTPPRQEVPEYYLPGSVREVAGVPGLRMVAIPGGSFLMGSQDGRVDEKPVHRVTVSSLEMSATEITQAQYQAVMGSNPSHFKGDDLPVESVSWNDAMDFCRKLSERTGQRFDLPTEAEWEYACRAGTTTNYYTGGSESALERACWYIGNSGQTTHAVGQKAANAFGLYDMHGNVLEWCNDWYGEYSSASQTNPTGPATGSYRVLRGGCWYFYANSCRSAVRDYLNPDYGNYGLGFRVVSR